MSGLQLKGVQVRYGSRTIIEQLDVDGIASGEVTSLLGPNGSGKSTLLKAVAGDRKSVV